MTILKDCLLKIIGVECKHNFPNCEFPLISLEQLVIFINQRLTECRATSILRLGDGEGNVLSRPTPEDTSQWSSVRRHFGPKITAHQIDSLANMLSCSIESADVVGIRDDVLNTEFHPNNFNLHNDEFLQRFQATFKLRPTETNLPYSQVLRLALLHRYLAAQKFSQDTLFISAWAHFELSDSGALIKMIRKQQRIGLISSKPLLAKAFKQQLKITIDFYKVPDIYKKTNDNQTFHIHFPDRFDQIMQTVRVEFPGQLFLVGAGICGKIYCNRIKELGGIALDIGAVCDAWINIPSRIAVYKSMYKQHDNSVPEKLLLEYQASKF